MTNLFLINTDGRLNNSLIYERQVESLSECCQLCLARRPQCRSINYGKSKLKCQLNNQTSKRKPDELVPAADFTYLEPFPVRLQNKFQLYIEGFPGILLRFLKLFTLLYQFTLLSQFCQF